MSWIAFKRRISNKVQSLVKSVDNLCGNNTTRGAVIIFYCGIDIAKNKHCASVINERGKQIGSAVSFSNTQEGCEKVVALFDKHGIVKDDLVIGMEATGHYWLSVYTFFAGNGYDTKVINPIQSDIMRKMSIQPIKNDARDSVVIAEVMRFGKYSSSEIADEKYVALRQLSRYRAGLVQEISDAKRRVVALLDQVFPEYDKAFTNIFGTTSKEILRNYATPEEFEAVSVKKLSKILNKASRGRFGDGKAASLKTIAKNSFGISVANKAFSFEIKMLMQTIEFLANQLSDLERELACLLSETKSFITSITGIGPVLGAAILGEIGDINRFAAAENLVSYAGLKCRHNDSGEFKSSQNHITKRGSPYLRRAVWLAATVAVRYDSTLSAYYQSLRARGKHHLVAINAVARKMCNIIFVILKENRPYEKVPPIRGKSA
jgi:transposase